MIAIYSRKSKFTGKGESVENQVEMCRDYVKTHLPNEEYVVYEDEGYSAKNLNRPQFKQMMEDLKTMHFSYIVVYRLDRISRNVCDFSTLVKKLNDQNVSFVCIKEQFDTSTSMGRAMMYIASVFAQLERETIAERIKDNMRLLARDGRWLGGNTPLGYSSQRVDIENKYHFKLIKNNDVCKVQTIFNKYIELQSLTGVIAYTANHDIKTINNVDFANYSIVEIIENPQYCEIAHESYNYFKDLGCQICFEENEIIQNRAFMVYNRREASEGGRMKTLTPDNWIVAMGEHEPIIKSDQWLKCQDIREISKGGTRFRRIHNPTSLLSGLLYCKYCGHRMRPRAGRVSKDGTQTFAYMCEYKELTKKGKCQCKNVNGKKLDNLVCETILNYIENDKKRTANCQISKIENLVKSSNDEKRKELSVVQDKVNELKESIKNLVSNLCKSTSDIVMQYIQAEIENKDSQLKELEKEKIRLETQVNTVKSNQEQYESLKSILTNFKTLFPYMTVNEKRDYLRILVDKIEWDGVKADIFIFGA